uniref:Mannosyltransferase n=1 Tax=Angiostrongylus cantonensis TaxID=6313 RepID=A0A0K0DLQ4_ANGCA
MASITNLNKPKDAFEQLEDEHGARQGFCHIRIQQRTGRKTITTVQGVGTEYDLKRIVRFLKKSCEVAHRAVFGTGLLTWEWSYALRSPFHPAIIAILFKVIQHFKLDSQTVIVNAPRILHAFLFSLGDISFYKLSRTLLPSPNSAFYSTVVYISTWFVFYCAPRTLSNCLETVLTLIALLWYPFGSRHLNATVWPYMSIGMLTIAIRPTAALLWIVLGFSHLLRHPNPLRLLFLTVLPATLPVLVLSTVVDSLCYARPTSTLWNFLSFNVLQGGSANFGVHPWYWYITEGLTAVLTIQLIPIVIGVFIPFRPTLLPLLTASFYVAFHSFLPHKEHRFLLPVIPLLCLYAGSFFTSRRVRFRHIMFFIMLITNTTLAVYFGVRHQIGPYNAADSVLSMARKVENASMAALMPCYSMPGHSYFHNDVSFIRMLDCTPNVDSGANSDESDKFHNDPEMWLDQHLDEVFSYSYIVMYEKTYLRMVNTFTRLHYSVCDRVFHSDFLVSERQDHYIKYSCNGTIVEHPEYGEVMQLSGDQRQQIKDFLVNVGIVKEENCKVHGF